MAKNPASTPEETNGAVRSAPPPGPAAPPPRLRERYLRDVVPALVRDFNYQNPMQVPRLAKISVNVGVGESIANSKALDAAVRDVTIITGQKPITIKARKSIAQFKLREQLIFPEINYDQVDKARGLEVSIITTARTDQEARRMLELLGMPFQREGDPMAAAAAAAAATRRRHH